MRQKTTTFNAKKAFTLPELLIATMILVLALCPIIMSFTYCFLLNENSRQITTAISHAQYVMEDIKNTDFDDITNGTLNSTDSDWPSNLTALPNETINATVTGSTLLNVNVTVSWDDRGDRPRIYKTLETLIAKP